MSTMEQIWKQFLTHTFSKTFSEFLTEQQIDERANWVVENLNKFDPKALYKSILYSMTDSAISKMAIGFKLHFILDDYKVLFNSPSTEEIDNNKSLTEEDKLVLNEIILNFCKAINHHMENVIVNNSRIEEIETAVQQVSDFLKLPHYEHLKPSFVKDGDLLYRMTFSQLLYCAVFNQNPFTGMPCGDELVEHVKQIYPHRYNMMMKLKEKWPTGIPLTYVRSTKIFS